MKHTKHFITTCLFFFNCSAILVAQQGNVAAGGEAIGTGGTMSYSIGQVDYLAYTSPQGSLSLGLQQPFLYSVPIVLEIPEIVISDGEVLCFNAEETVIVAGDGKLFTVQDGGSAEIIAGIHILIREGATVEYGGMLHAYISSDYCNQQVSLLASFDEQIIPIEPVFEPENSNGFFKVYPNPTTGNFTLELLEFEEHSIIQLEIFTMQGHLILSKELPVEQRYTLSLAERQPGIYLIRVLKDKEIGICKIIKQ